MQAWSARPWTGGSTPPRRTNQARPEHLVKAGLKGATLAHRVSFVGILVSIQFHNRKSLGGIVCLFGSLTTAFIGLLYYCVPRLWGAPRRAQCWGESEFISDWNEHWLNVVRIRYIAAPS